MKEKWKNPNVPQSAHKSEFRCGSPHRTDSHLNNVPPICCLWITGGGGEDCILLYCLLCYYYFNANGSVVHTFINKEWFSVEKL